MADSTNTYVATPPPETAGGKWTEGEKSSLMVQIIGQLTSAGAKVNLSALNMPGRTPKALTHMIGKIKEEATTFNTGSGDHAAAAAAALPAVVTPKAPRGGSARKAATTSAAGRKRGKKVDPEGEFNGGDDIDEGTPVKKRARRTPRGKQAAPAPAPAPAPAAAPAAAAAAAAAPVVAAAATAAAAAVVEAEAAPAATEANNETTGFKAPEASDALEVILASQAAAEALGDEPVLDGTA